MQNQSQIFDVLITHEDLDLLQKQNRQLKQIIQSLQQDNDELNILINGLTDDIRKHAPYVEQGIELQKKTRSLSKYVLKLMNLAFTLKEKIEKGSHDNKASQQTERQQKYLKKLKQAQKRVEQLEQEKDQAVKMKKQIEDQLDISRIMQSQMQEKLIQLKQYISMLQNRLLEKEEVDHQELQLKVKKSEKDLIENQCERNLLELNLKNYQASLADLEARLKQKDQTIRELKETVTSLKAQMKLIEQQRDQLRICKDWKLGQQYIEKVYEKYGDKDGIVLQLKKRIKQLEQEQQNYDYLFENQRNLMEQIRKKVEEKEKAIILREKQIKHQQTELENKKQRMDRLFQRRQQSLQSQYINKVKSLKEFGDCPECDKQKQKYVNVIKQLKVRLEKSDRINAQKQDMINYVNELLGNLKREQEMTLQVLIDREIGQIVARWCNSSETIIDQLLKKEQQWINLICEKCQKVQLRVNQKRQG